MSGPLYSHGQTTPVSNCVAGALESSAIFPSYECRRENSEKLLVACSGQDLVETGIEKGKRPNQIDQRGAKIWALRGSFLLSAHVKFVLFLIAFGASPDMRVK